MTKKKQTQKTKTVFLESKPVENPEDQDFFYSCGHKVIMENLKIIKCAVCYEYTLWSKIVRSDILREIDQHVKKTQIPISVDMIDIIRGKFLD